MTSGQQATFKTWLLANAAGLSDQAAGDLANANTSPAYWVWRTSVARSDIYNTVDDAGNSWSWATYKAQAAVEQNAWVQMFMGDIAPFNAVNTRQGVQSIFGGAAPGNAQRDHCFAVARRPATNFEQLFVTAVVSPPANTGNDGNAGNRGTKTNPDLLVLEGQVTSQQVAETRG